MAEEIVKQEREIREVKLDFITLAVSFCKFSCMERFEPRCSCL